jgi:hypothetical protein
MSLEKQNYIALLRYKLSVTSDHGYVLFVVIAILSHSWLITGFATRVTWRVPHLEQVPLTLPRFRGVRVSRTLVFCVMFCSSLFVILSLFVWPLRCLSFNLWLLGIFTLSALTADYKTTNDMMWSRCTISFCDIMSSLEKNGIKVCVWLASYNFLLFINFFQNITLHQVDSISKYV